ncbi:MAG: FIST C-terminal domain-containing protein [Ignavibacteriales bacterium]|nr:FIST C-terminal domain-containing protein [Ignavibacteriales bacterium]
MKTEQRRWSNANGWENPFTSELSQSVQVVFVFGSLPEFINENWLTSLKKTFPKAILFGCSTAGEIYGTQVTDETVVATAVHFEKTKIQVSGIQLAKAEESFHAGEELAKALEKTGLVHVIVLSDGLNVNGSELVAGLSKRLPTNVTVTGGLSGDGDRFKETFVVWKGAMQSHTITILGLYGEHLRVGYGSLGGWDSFGPERLITKSRGNVLYELDGKSALELYKNYLGEHAKELPASGLLFPLSLRTKEGESGVVRTILAVDEDEQSMTFAGDVPEGAYARLMKANFDHLIDGAVGAAKTSYEAIGSSSPDLALLISCVGRKLVLKQRIEEEVEGVRDVLGEKTVLMGFYSYGEISPFTPSAKCELHNQTMTITTLSER